MLIFNCSKAAADFFSSTQKGKKTSPIEPAPHKTIADSMAELGDESNLPAQWQWLLHVIKVKGKNVLITMDYQTRFSITLSTLKKGDKTAFLNNFDHHLMVHAHHMMITANADPQAIDNSLKRYRHQHNNCAFYLRGDRSVQTHINDVAWHFRRWVNNNGTIPTEVDLIELDTASNKLFKRHKAEKKHFTPQAEFLHAWLRHYAEYNTAEADAGINFLKRKELAEFAAKHPTLFNSKPEHAASDPQSKTAEPQRSSNAHTEYDNNVITLQDHRKKS